MTERDLYQEDADFNVDVDHLGRRLQPQRDQGGRSNHNNQARPPLNGRRAPYQYGQSHRYMMDYQQDGRVDNYFNQYDHGYGRNQGNSYQQNFYNNGRS